MKASRSKSLFLEQLSMEQLLMEQLTFEQLTLEKPSVQYIISSRWRVNEALNT